MYTKFVALAAGALLLSGCTALPWLHPVIAESRAVFDDGLNGIWQDKDVNRIVVSRSAGSAVAYQVVYLNKSGSATVFEGTLAKIGDTLLMDVTPTDAGVLQIPVHGLVRIWLSGDQLRWAFADSDWMKDQIATRGLPTQRVADAELVIGATSAVSSQVLEAAGDDRAYGDITEMRRIR